jgi:ketosteroid isomerase-like protein
MHHTSVVNSEHFSTDHCSTHLAKIINFYQNLRPVDVIEIDVLYHAQAYFKDPFNAVTGTPAIKKIFEHMFQTTKSPRFVFIDALEQGEQAFVTWQFLFELYGKDYSVNGSSHLKFNSNEQVFYHRDYWDAAEELLQKIPVIGLPMRWLRKRFEVNSQ